jgi:ATP-dependent DNA ligase
MDLVPIGAWHGNGRKAKWWSPILLALRNEEEGTLQAVCKCMSGFTDQFYKDLNITYSPDGPNTTFEKPWEYESALTPDSTSPTILQGNASLVCSEGSLGVEVCGCDVESCLYCCYGFG